MFVNSTSRVRPFLRTSGYQKTRCNFNYASLRRLIKTVETQSYTTTPGVKSPKGSLVGLDSGGSRLELASAPGTSAPVPFLVPNKALLLWWRSGAPCAHVPDHHHQRSSVAIIYHVFIVPPRKMDRKTRHIKKANMCGFSRCHHLFTFSLMPAILNFVSPKTRFPAK